MRGERWPAMGEGGSQRTGGGGCSGRREGEMRESGRDRGGACGDGFLCTVKPVGGGRIKNRRKNPTKLGGGRIDKKNSAKINRPIHQLPH